MSTEQTLYQKAQKYIPGGVNSPVRSFNGVGGEPIFIKSAHGAYLVDEDNKEYVDYIGSWGPMIVGHAHPAIIDAVTATLKNGLSFGAPTSLEIQLAQKIQQIMPSIELVRMVNSGTEATMSAIRLARGFTQRNKIVKFAGGYHGHSDSLLVAAGSGSLTLGVPSSAGVPASIAEHTLVAEYNNLNNVRELFNKYGEDIATIIVEPIAGNMNCVPATKEFLEGLRILCNEYGSVLIFDEVMTGFRVAKGGAEEYFQIKPDLTTLGKIIGGGMPVGAFGGRADIMRYISPLGPVYQAGTLSGNPIAMIAGLTTLELISKPHFYAELTTKTQALTEGLAERAKIAHIPFYTTAVCGMFGLYFTDQEKIMNLSDVKKCDVARFQKFFHAMLQHGIFFAPSAYEAGFISIAHGDTEIAKTLAAAEKVFKVL